LGELLSGLLLKSSQVSRREAIQGRLVSSFRVVREKTAVNKMVAINFKLIQRI